MKIRVLITGAGGVVGRALTDLLRRSNEYGEVIALASRQDCNLEDFDQAFSVFQFVRPQLVFHLAAAVFGLGGNSAFPAEAYRRNILINTHVVECARLFGVKKMVAMGSAAIYADNETGYFTEQYALAGEPHASEQAYAIAKRAMLVQLESYKLQYSFPFAYAIATNLYGPHDRFDGEYGHVIPSLIYKFDRAAVAGSIVEVWGDGTPTRDFLFCEDAAAGLELIMRKGEGRYNLATGQSHSIGDLVSCIAREFPGVSFKWDAARPNGQQRRSYDVSRLKTLGFTASVSLREGIRRTVRWMHDNRSHVRSYAPGRLVESQIG